MKITIMASGHLPLPKTYDLDSITSAPNVGDIVTISGRPFEVYERVFDFEKDPGGVTLLCKRKGE
jgi:hypothetical protein